MLLQHDSGALLLAPLANLNLKRTRVLQVREGDKEQEFPEGPQPCEFRVRETLSALSAGPTALLLGTCALFPPARPFLFPGVPGQSLRVTAGVLLSSSSHLIPWRQEGPTKGTLKKKKLLTYS